MKSSLVEAAGRGDGGIVVDPLAAVHGPVVVAVVVHVAVSVKHQTILTRLLGQGACIFVTRVLFIEGIGVCKDGEGVCIEGEGVCIEVGELSIEGERVSLESEKVSI